MGFLKFGALLLALTAVVPAYAQTHFDEVFSKGRVRKHYQPFWDIYSMLTPDQIAHITQKSIKDFKGDNALLALPRVLTAQESDLLKKGAEQRARAIQLFLKDHYSGKRMYQKSGMIPAELIQDAIERNKETKMQDALTNVDFSFWYGPDIIRDGNGQFRVIEDNIGFIGGMGDLRIARESIVKNIPGYEKLMDHTYDPNDFYLGITKRYRESAKELGGKALLITYPDEIAADNEDSRVRKIFAEEGISSYIFNHHSGSAKQSLIIRNDELYLMQYSGGKKKMTLTKITHVILDVEAQDFAAIGKKNRLEQFWSLVNSGKVRVTNSIGLEFVNDKGVYPYVEEMIQLYLHEEPILRNIETYTASNSMIKVARKEKDLWVAKGVTGRGGDSVYIGSKQTPEQWDKILAEIEKNYNGYIFQKFTPLSVMADHIVDLRVITDVLGESAYATQTPWGRALPTSGNGKVNISDQGRETTVISIHEDFCNSVMKSRARAN